MEIWHLRPHRVIHLEAAWRQWESPGRILAVNNIMGALCKTGGSRNSNDMKQDKNIASSNESSSATAQCLALAVPSHGLCQVWDVRCSARLGACVVWGIFGYGCFQCISVRVNLIDLLLKFRMVCCSQSKRHSGHLREVGSPLVIINQGI